MTKERFTEILVELDYRDSDIEALYSDMTPAFVEQLSDETLRSVARNMKNNGSGWVSRSRTLPKQLTKEEFVELMIADDFTDDVIEGLYSHMQPKLAPRGQFTKATIHLANLLAKALAPNLYPSRNPLTREQFDALMFKHNIKPEYWDTIWSRRPANTSFEDGEFFAKAFSDRHPEFVWKGGEEANG